MLFNCKCVNRVLWLILLTLVLFVVYGIIPAHAQQGKVPDQEIQKVFANAGIKPANAIIPVKVQKRMEITPNSEKLFSDGRFELMLCTDQTKECRILFTYQVPTDEVLKENLFGQEIAEN